MEIKIEHMIDTGCGGRKNQDIYWVKRNLIKHKPIILAMVCDGISGACDGKRASYKTMDYVIGSLWANVSKYIEEHFSMEQIGQQLDMVLKKANQSLFKESIMSGRQTGTTIAIFFMLGHSYLIANVGDSRVYWHKTKGLYRTKDHTASDLKNVSGYTHVLWQSVGSQEDLIIDQYYGDVELPMEVLLLTNRAYRNFQKQEIRDFCLLGDLNKMKKQARLRKEQDSMTGVRIQIR
ncbi:MAG: hypothetical protein Q4D45_08030 [Lachnospiraceae bacterium]|nr:hypothetical protein [Lachnospiraceae bacterium]